MIFSGFVAVCVNTVLSYDGFTEKKEFYRTNAGLTSVPADLPVEAMLVNLRDNNITRIETNAFQHLSVCVKLYLHQNSVSVIQDGAFNGLVSFK